MDLLDKTQLPDFIDPAKDLEKVRLDAKAMVKKRARVSAGVAIVPVPFLDVAVDSAVLAKLLPEISARFGLIDDPKDAAHIRHDDNRFESFKNSILTYGNLAATRIIAKKTVQGFARRIAGKQVSKFIPFGGSIVAGALGYSVFKKIAFDHIDECYKLAKEIQIKTRENPELFLNAQKG